MQKVHAGSGILLAFLFLSGVSVLLTGLYIRTSFLLRTVVEREQQLKWRFAAEGLMCYAIAMAKHNWAFLLKQTQSKEIEWKLSSWLIDEHTKCEAYIAYEKSLDKSNKGVCITVYLMYNGNEQAKLKSVIVAHEPTQTPLDRVDNVKIIDWYIY